MPRWRRWSAPWSAPAGAGAAVEEIVGEVPHGSPIAGLEAWRGLTQWEDEAPVGQPGSQPVEPRKHGAAGAHGR